MQARYYDPVIGRFLSIDPMDFMGSGMNPGYFNRYAYNFNDPVNFFDPTGKYRCSESDCGQVDKFVERIVEARDASNEGSEDRAVLDGVIDALGPKGEEGSVMIKIDNTLTASGEYSEKTGDIKLNLDAHTTKSGKLDEHGAARTLTHEGKHLGDHQKNGSIKSRSERFQREKNAYKAGNAFDRGHRRTPSNSNPDAAAERSVRDECRGSNISSCG